jgi:hypothetical protein
MGRCNNCGGRGFVTCENCNGDGGCDECDMSNFRECEQCLGVGEWPEIDTEQKQRIDALFHAKLAREDPNHPWLDRASRHACEPIYRGGETCKVCGNRID